MDKEVTFKLPKGWIWATLGDLGVIVSGGTPSTNTSRFWGDEIAWITPADLSNYESKYITKGRRNISKLGLDYSSATLLPANSVLFSSRAPIGYVVIAKQELSTNQGFKNIIPVDSTNIEYLYYYLLSAKQEAVKRARGTTFLEISAKSFSQIPIPLAPIEEQKNIVAKIEEIFVELSDAKNSLDKALKLLSIYEYSILKNAIQGNLTKSWRENNPNYSASKYLSAVQKSRKEKFDDEIGTKKKPNDRFEYLRHNEIKTWGTAKLDKLITIAARVGWKGLKKEEYTSKGPLFLSVHSLNHGKHVNFDEAFHISEERYFESPEIMLQLDDILLCKDGAGIGKIAIVKRLPGNATINSSILIIRGGDIFNSDFLYYLFKGPQMQRLVNEQISGSAIPHLFQKDIREFQLDIPPLEEQREIVEEIEYRFAIVENLKGAIKDNQKRSEILRQIILKNAFVGKLTNEEYDSESGINLLQQLREEIRIAILDQKEISKAKPKKIKIMEEKKSIIEILKANKEPISAKDLWLQSEHKDDIESFYSELRKLQNEIVEIKKDTESLISLRYEN
jgi:type I restriction enzyme S subunit